MKTTATEHEHQWAYVSAVYNGSRGGSMVRRWCSGCGQEQVGMVNGWRKPRKNEFDESAAKAAKETT